MPTSVPTPGKRGVTGLAQMNNLDQLLVRQKVELCEAVTGFEQKNKYQICDRDGQEVFFLREETSCCTRNCCGPQHQAALRVQGQNLVSPYNLQDRGRCCDQPAGQD